MPRGKYVHRFPRPIDETLRLYVETQFRRASDDTIQRAIPLVSDLFRRLRDEAKRRGIWDDVRRQA